MEVKDYIALHDFVADDANGDKALSPEESLALAEAHPTANTPEAIEDARDKIGDLYSRNCTESVDASGNRTWQGGQYLYTHMMPENFNVKAVAKRAAYDLLMEETPDLQVALRGLRALDPKTLDELVSRSPEQFGGEKAFEDIKSRFDAAVAEGEAYIEAWKEQQTAALPGGIELAQGPDFARTWMLS